MRRPTLMAICAVALICPSLTMAQTAAADPANRARYAEANRRLGPPAAGEARVVFMGNSITEAWAPHFAALFPDKPYVGRGISGQTTAQMLGRFADDVIALSPRAVVILGGTNDIAGNGGPVSIETTQNNLAAMADSARAHGIRVVLCAVLPVYDYPWRRGLEPAPKIVALNTWLRNYAASHDAVFVDLHTPLADERQGLPLKYAADGVHPNLDGYKVMSPLVEAGIRAALVGR
ncbi:MAG: SGNH/GDSL hydrolase family protein [Gemmatimonadaceae bacterium]|nr:SGNH/GDSL hydrolase family protein [Gemmatimonadaceae bacterium]